MKSREFAEESKRVLGEESFDLGLTWMLQNIE